MVIIGEFSGVLTFRATKAGFLPATTELNIQGLCERCTPRFYLALESVDPIVTFEPGTYTLTFTADPACTRLPLEARRRTYVATVSRATGAHTGSYDVRVPRVGLLDFHNSFLIGMSGTYLATEDYAAPTFFERMTANTYVAIDFLLGTTRFDIVPPAGVSLVYAGSFEYCSVRPGVSPQLCDRFAAETLIEYDTVSQIITIWSSAGSRGTRRWSGVVSPDLRPSDCDRLRDVARILRRPARGRVYFHVRVTMSLGWRTTPMTPTLMALIALGAVLVTPIETRAQSARLSGEAVYATHCASCHDQVSARIPSREALTRMSPSRILRTLDFGLMMSISYPMRRDEREAVATFLGRGAEDAAPPPSAFCRPDVSIASGPSRESWGGWSPSGELLAQRPEPSRRVDIAGRFAPSDPLRVAPLLQEPIGSPVVVAGDVRHRRRVELGQRAHVGRLGRQPTRGPASRR